MAIIGDLNGIILNVPDRGQTEWADIMTLVFQVLSAHDHTGNGKGAKLGTASFENLSITTALLANLSVTTAKLADLSVSTAKLIDLNVTTVKLADDAVTNAKLADNAVGTDNIINSAVTTIKILDSNVTTAKIADSNVTTAKIADSNVTTIKVAADAIDDTKIRLRNNQWLRGRNLANNADVNIVKINASNAIEFGGSVTAAPAVNSVGTAEIQDNAVTNAKMADNSVNTAEIVDNAVTTAKIALGAVITADLADNAVTKLKSNEEIYVSESPIVTTTGTIDISTVKNSFKCYVLNSGVTASTIFSMNFTGEHLRLINPTGGSLTVRVLNDGNGLGNNIAIAANTARDFIAINDSGGYRIVALAAQALTNLTLS